MTTKASDRRRAPRAPVLLSVQYETFAASQKDAKTVDISKSGLFLGTKDPLPVGTTLELVIGDAARVKVRVARVVEADAAGTRTPGMGCQILEADEAARQSFANELARTPPREVKVVNVATWPAAVPIAPKNAGSARDGNGHDRGASETGPQQVQAPHAQGGNDRRSKKDKKRNKGQKADLFADKPE